MTSTAVMVFGLPTCVSVRVKTSVGSRGSVLGEEGQVGEGVMTQV